LIQRSKSFLTGSCWSFVKESCAGPEKRLFPISYNAARITVRKAGRLLGIHLRPHGLQRHAATFASRPDTPIEISRWNMGI
jgi:hypothetical protein